MTDNNITIGIRTAGAADAVADLDKVAVACQAVTKEQLTLSNAPAPRNDIQPASSVEVRSGPPVVRDDAAESGFYQESSAGFSAAVRDAGAVNPDRDDVLAYVREAEAAIIANAEAGIRDLQTGADETITKAAGEAKAFLEARAAEAGDAISASAGAALDALTKTIADAVIQPAELSLLQQAMHQMKVSREASNTTILAAIRESMAADQSLQNQIDALRAQMMNFTGRAR